MKPGEFEFNGVSSLNYNMRIQHEPELTGPAGRWANYTVSARHGTRYKRKSDKLDSTKLSLDCVFLDTGTWATRDAILDWLDTNDYVSFIPYWDEAYEYRAVVIDPQTIAHTRKTVAASTVKLELELYPLKYLRTSLLAVPVASGDVIYNPSRVAAEPLIELIAEGDTTLTVGGVEYSFKDLTGTTTIDSDLLECSGTMVGYLYPTIPEGQSTISFSSNVKLCQLTPRYCRKVG